MIASRVAGIVGFAGFLVVAVIACGGGVPDPSEAALGAATGAGSASAEAGAPGSPAAPGSKGTTIPAGGSAADAGRDAAAAKQGNGFPNPFGDDDDGFGGLPGVPGLPGQAGTIAVGEDCCFNGHYFHCPNTQACLGGNDVFGCINACDRTDIDCIENCANGAQNAGGPTGCDANAAPPPGVDCANGQIDK